MKVLHVHDCAFVARNLIKALRKKGLQVKYIPLSSTLSMARAIRYSQADLVHVHYAKSPAYAALLSGKRYIVHCHGDDVRHGINRLQNYALKRAALILYGTPDLKEPLFEKGFTNSIYLPTPVDMEMFYGEENISSNRALYMMQTTSASSLRRLERQHIDNLRKFCDDRGLSLQILERRDIPYEDMPQFLSKFKVFCDRIEPKSWSKTALEAMAMKRIVVGWDYSPKDVEENYQYVKKVHDSNIVAEKLIELYEQVEKRR